MHANLNLKLWNFFHDLKPTGKHRKIFCDSIINEIKVRPTALAFSIGMRNAMELLDWANDQNFSELAQSIDDFMIQYQKILDWVDK